MSSMLKSSWSKSAMALNTMDLEASWSGRILLNPLESWPKERFEKRNNKSKKTDNTVAFSWKKPPTAGGAQTKWLLRRSAYTLTKNVLHLFQRKGMGLSTKKNCQLFLVKKKPSLLPRVATSYWAYWAFCCFGCCGVEPPLHIRVLVR